MVGRGAFGRNLTNAFTVLGEGRPRPTGWEAMAKTNLSTRHYSEVSLLSSTWRFSA